MRFKVISILIFCLPAMAFQYSQNGHELDPSAFEKALKLSRFSSFHEKRLEAGAFRTAVGAQLMPSCLSLIRKDAQIKASFKRFDVVLNDAVSRTLQCGEKYPELDEYILQWIKGTITSKLECVEKTSIESNAAAWNNQHGITTLPKDTFQRFFEEISSNEPRPENLYYLSDSLVDTLIHEGFHSTQANNRADHNDIELILFSKKCGAKDASQDRIAMIESLCSTDMFYSNSKRAAQLIFEKISKCGIESGCMDLFTNKLNNIRPEDKIPSKDLPRAKAARLCEKIYEEGYCFHVRDTQGEILTNSLPRVKAIQKKIALRLESILPVTDNQIRREFIRTFSDLEKDLGSLSQTSCFQSLFQSDEKGNLYLRLPASQGWPVLNHFPWMLFQKPGLMTPDQIFLGRIKKPIEMKINSISRCSNMAERQELLRFIERLYEKMNLAFQDSLSWERIADVMRNEMGKVEYWDPFSIYKQGNPTLEEAIGKDLTQELDETMKTHHYASRFFDCRAAGFNSFP